MDRRVIIDLSTENVIWDSENEKKGASKDRGFHCRLQTGDYLALEHEGEKAAIFPFEVFQVGGQLLYFGPIPHRYQPVFTTISRNFRAHLKAETQKPEHQPAKVLRMLLLFPPLLVRHALQLNMRRLGFYRSLLFILITLVLLPQRGIAPQPNSQEVFQHALGNRFISTVRELWQGADLRPPGNKLTTHSPLPQPTPKPLTGVQNPKKQLHHSVRKTKTERTRPPSNCRGAAPQIRLMTLSQLKKRKEQCP